MLTPEQETFLAAFADQGLQGQYAEEARVKEANAAREKQAAIDAALTDLKAKQDAEIQTLLASFDTAEAVPVEVTPN